MDGIAKTHFKQALNANYLVHAEFRSHSSPVAHGVGVVGVYGVDGTFGPSGWLTSTSANAQVSRGSHGVDVLGRLHVPNQCWAWSPHSSRIEVSRHGIWHWFRIGFENPPAIERRWTLGGGLEWVRRASRHPF